MQKVNLLHIVTHWIIWSATPTDILKHLFSYVLPTYGNCAAS